MGDSGYPGDRSGVPEPFWKPRMGRGREVGVHMDSRYFRCKAFGSEFRKDPRIKILSLSLPLAL